MSFLEGLWARGDRTLGRLLVSAYQNRCRFDGWSDRFKYSRWERALSESQVDAGFFTTRKRNLHEPLPWDHIDIRVDKTFLKNEWMRAFKELPTQDCRWHACHQCGVCDFKKVSPDLSLEEIAITVPGGKQNPEGKPGDQLLCITYSKTGEAKFFGHLELMNIFLRALRRSKVSLKHSRGFHPMPKVSFEDPLPIGIESLQEHVYITLSNEVDPQEVMRRLNQELPLGLWVQDCSNVSSKRPTNKEKLDDYSITLKTGVFDKEKADRFQQEPVFSITRTNKKGAVKSIDLKSVVFRLDLIRQDSLNLRIKQVNGKVVRPQEILSAVFGLSDLEIKKASIVKGTFYV